MTDAATLARRIAQGCGDEPADLVIRGARLLDLVTGPEWPKGMVPLSPTLRLPEAATKVVGFVDANWHWKRPFSSGFFGASVQYGTESDVGCVRSRLAEVYSGERDTDAPNSSAAGQRSVRT